MSDDFGEPLTAALEREGTKQPGTIGWWKVYGARTMDVWEGDMAALKWEDEGYREFLIREAVTPEGLWDTCAPRFKVGPAEVIRIGQLQQIVLYLFGTHNTLADSVR